MIVFGRKNHPRSVSESMKQVQMFGCDFKRIACGSSLILVFLACQPYTSAADTQSAARAAGHSSKTAAAHLITEAQLVEKLRNAKVTDEAFGLSAKISPDEIVVMTDKDAKFGENEVKAQSVLIAKTAFGLVPSSIERTRVIFRDSSNYRSQIIVNRTEIDSFGKGETTQTQLLKSLALERVPGESVATVNKAVPSTSSASPSNVSGSPKPRHGMGALIFLLRENQVSIENELVEMKTAHQNGTNDRAFHYRMLDKLLRKFNTLPKSVRQSFMVAHPELFTVDKAAGKATAAGNAAASSRNAASAQSLVKTDNTRTTVNAAGRRCPPYQAK